MIIFPAIDLKDGQCVRLVQGVLENKTVYSDRPEQVAAMFEDQGAQWLHIVDLDGAFTGSPRNSEAIRAIASAINIPFQVGGGLRTVEDVKRVLKLGAGRVIIGTRALQQDFISQLLDQFGPDRIVLGLDAKDGMVAVEGWVQKSDLNALDFACRMKTLGINTAVFTDVAKDGLLKGPNLRSIEEMARVSGLQIIASGGVSSVENIRALKAMEPAGVCGAIIGKALYDGKITLQEALAV
jgi:phosphoribosylformimino-5-aminoimidazole carboxamide ribotide isomerase